MDAPGSLQLVSVAQRDEFSLGASGNRFPEEKLLLNESWRRLRPQRLS